MGRQRLTIVFIEIKTREAELQQRLDAAKCAVGDVLVREDEVCLDELAMGIIPPHLHDVSQLAVRVDLRRDDGATAPHGASGHVKPDLNRLSYCEHDACKALSSDAK